MVINIITKGIIFLLYEESIKIDTKLMHLNREKHGPRTWIYNSQKRKIQFAGKQKYSKDRLTSSKKKKNVDQKNKPHFLPFQNGKKKHTPFLEGKYCQCPQMSKLKLPFGLAIQKDKEDILNVFTLLPSNFLSRTSAQGNKRRKVKIFVQWCPMQYYSMSYKSQKEKAAYDDKVKMMVRIW